jgi:hypothetical protein
MYAGNLFTVETYRRHYNRAKVEGIRLRPFRDSRGNVVSGKYHATSSKTGANAYVVDARIGMAFCSCPAGQNDTLCKHLIAGMAASGTQFHYFPGLLKRAAPVARTRARLGAVA